MNGSATDETVLAQTLEIRAEFNKGPLPNPAILTEYEKACPGAANRIITMAEKAQEHRHELERRGAVYLDRDQEIDSKDRRWGMWFAFLLSVGAMSGAVFCLSIGQPIGATGFGVGGAVLLSRLFLKRRNDDEDDDESGEVEAAGSKASEHTSGSVQVKAATAQASRKSKAKQRNSRPRRQ